MSRYWYFFGVAAALAANVAVYAYFQNPISAGGAAFILVMALSMVGRD
jgi:hypothetical protein